MADKVYCGQCKNYTGTMTRGDKDHVCTAPENEKIIDTWLMKESKRDRKPDQINKNNDCTWYKPIR